MIRLRDSEEPAFDIRVIFSLCLCLLWLACPYRYTYVCVYMFAPLRYPPSTGDSLCWSDDIARFMARQDKQRRLDFTTAIFSFWLFRWSFGSSMCLSGLSFRLSHHTVSLYLAETRSVYEYDLTPFSFALRFFRHIVVSFR